MAPTKTAKGKAADGKDKEKEAPSSKVIQRPLPPSDAHPTVAGAGDGGRLKRFMSLFAVSVAALAGAMFRTGQAQELLVRYDIDLEKIFGQGGGGSSSGTTVTGGEDRHRKTLGTLEGIVPVEVFENAESAGGVAFNLTYELHGSVEDVGMVLSKLHGCTGSYMDPGGPEDPGFCKVYNQLGQRVRSLESVQPQDRLYLVPHDRLFIFPAVHTGYKFELPHIKTPKGGTVTLETLSDHPKVFKLDNFMDDSEADTIIQEALALKHDAYKLKRSSTEAGGHTTIDKTRTSENAFVTSTATAMAIKRRVFELLGIEQYDEHWADGLQVLRYNVSKAYNYHLDYIKEIASDDHDFKSEAYGSNRFATVVLYFNDVEEGGETVFTKQKMPGTPSVAETVSKLREERGEFLDSIGITQGSWEERLVAECSVGLAAKPRRGDAVLFYSQLPNGAVDSLSEHGACPVLKGVKWAANLWVWNGPRHGYTKKDPITGRMIDIDHGKKEGDARVNTEYPVVATFVNAEGGPPAELYFQDTRWDSFEPGKTIRVNSFIGHEWNVKHAETGDLLQQWKVEKRIARQVFKLQDSPSLSGQ